LLRVLFSFALGFLIPAVTIIFVEILPKKRRGAVMTLMGLFFVLG